MKILIAPNAFKQSLTARAAAEAIAEGFRMSKLSCECILFPVGDGGTGTGPLITAHFGGTKIPVTTQDPLGRAVVAEYGLIDQGRTAVIEVASASGIQLLAEHELDPLRASTYGTGVLIRHALRLGVRKFVIGVGGSATVDGGAGLLQALGVRFFDGNGRELAGYPADLKHIAYIDWSNLEAGYQQSEVTVLCDVDNPLLGTKGGIRMFGCQKGASDSDIESLEAILTTYIDLLQKRAKVNLRTLPSGGAAGGVCVGLHAIGNIQFVNGIEHFLALTGFDERLSCVQWVVTGEGSIDEQTLRGKAPFGVAKRAKRKGLPVIALVGMRPGRIPEELNSYFDSIFAIGNAPMDFGSAVGLTKANLIEVAKQIGNTMAMCIDAK